MNELLAGIDWNGWLSRAGVSLMRTSGLMLFLPIFGAALIPARVRVWLTLAMAVVLAPIVPPLVVAPGRAFEWGLIGLHEFTIGLGLGISARAVFAAYEMAAQLVAGQSGFSLANMVDPVTGGQTMAPALYMIMLSSVLFLSADLHHVFLHALRSSWELLPPAVAIPDTSGLDVIASRLGLRLFTIAIELAAPAMVLAFAMDLLLALVGRTMPRVPIILVGYPAKLFLALIGLGLLTIAAGTTLGKVGRTIADDAGAVLSALGAR
jgi:flagellar biosynthetic protein FliR